MAYGFTRTELLDAVVSALVAASTGAGARVYKSRTSAIAAEAGAYPVILVWNGGSSDANILDACTTPAEGNKTSTFACQALVVLNGTATDAAVDAALDTLEEQVRSVLQGAVSWSSGLDMFEQLESVSASYGQPQSASDGKGASVTLTFTVTHGVLYG